MFFLKIGFLPINTDLYILAYQPDDVFIIATVYLDHFTISPQNHDKLDWLKNQLI